MKFFRSLLVISLACLMLLTGCQSGNTLPTEQPTQQGSQGTTEQPDVTASNTVTEQVTQEPTPSATEQVTLTPTASPSVTIPTVTQTPTNAPTATPKPSDETTKKPEEVAPVVHKKGSDYTYFWWDYGVANGKRNAYVQTGNYGFMMDARTGKIKNLGGITGVDRDTVSESTNHYVDALPSVKSVTYNIKKDNFTDEAYMTSYVHNDKYPMSSPAQEGPGVTNALRIISSGTYMQRFDLMQLVYRNTEDFVARAEYACVSDYFTVTYDAQSKKDRFVDVQLSYSMELDSSYVLYKTCYDGKAVIFRNNKGQSVAFIMPLDGSVKLTVEENVVTAASDVRIANNKWLGYSFVIMPGLDLTEDHIASYYASQQVKVTAVNKEPKESKAVIDWNPLTGAVEIQMPNSSDFTDYTVEANRTAYERTPFTLTNDSDENVRVTVCFYKRKVYPHANYGLWGMSPMIVDPKTNEPTGIAVQYSRNPHNYIGFNEVLYGSCWVNCYVYFDIPAHSSVSYDFVCAFSAWGETYASSIAQMCLVGWGGNQWWMSASIGSSTSYGETFGFDPERGCGRAIIDDSSPLFTNPTIGAGGADWLSVHNSLGYRDVRLQKVTVKVVGPNVSQMKLSGYLDDKSVYVEMTVTISRSNDYSKMINSFHYEFIKDTKFNRLLLYSLGADNYNGIRFEKLAYGDSTGTKETLSVPRQGTGSGYLKQYVDMKGSNVWVSQYQFDAKNANCTKGMAVREYKATLNGKTYDYPTLSFYITNNGCTNLSAELSLPKEIADGGVVNRGSVVDGAVEYIIFPENKNDYYGTSQYIKSMDASLFANEGLMYRYAMDARITESVNVGKLVGTYPTKVQTVKGKNTVAEVTIKGGIGYVPVIFTELDSYSGYRLFEVDANGKEKMVDQSVKGNDYWQVYRNPDTELYDIAFNVFQTDGKAHTYRLKKV